MILESETARLAATRRTEEDLENLEATISAMEAARDGSIDDMLTADLEFHVGVARASGNRAVIAVSLGLRRLLEEGLRSGYWPAGRAVADHRKIVAAIRSCNPSAAARRMQAHLEWVTTILPQETLGQPDDSTSVPVLSDATPAAVDGSDKGLSDTSM
jgi:GntR family transcriptional repressor for pyruvate dehydrogenase complex